MHRFFASPETTQGTTITLAPTEAHHAVHVLRLRPGDRAVVLNGEGEEILGEIIEADRHNVRLHITQRQRNAPFARPVTLLQAVPKARSMEVIIQKATELGAARIVPLLSERTVAHWEDEAAAQRTARWRTTAIEAAKQSGASWLPQIENPTSITAFLNRNESFDLPLLASLQPGATHPAPLFEAFRLQHRRSPNSIAIWVGPEGDFTPAEINSIRATAAFPITLGPLVLRCETAALYCLAFASYELHRPAAGTADTDPNSP